jgi:hypothetical protein
LDATKEEDISEQVLFNRIFVGLRPCVAKVLPTPPPSTLDEFVFGGKVGELIPVNDPDWKIVGGEQSASQIVKIEVKNEYSFFGSLNPKECFKCGVKGHITRFCIKPQRLRNRRKKRPPMQSVSAGGIRI